MISVEDKIAVFSQHLLEEQKKRGQCLIDTANKSRKEKMAEAESALFKEKRAMEEHNYNVIFRDKNRLIAQGKSSAKNSKLEQRQLIVDDFLKTLKKDANLFLEKPVYKDFLTRGIKELSIECGSNCNLVVFARKEDQSLIKELFDSQEVTNFVLHFKELADHYIGGMIVEDQTGRVHFDYSVENLILENEKTIGIRLKEYMKQQVSDNDK